MRIKANLLVLFILLLALLFASSVSAECQAYRNSMPVDYGFNRGGYECAGTGPGCQQCIDYNQNGSGKSCIYDWWGWAVDCYYWGPEFQNL
jgi:hypothetical protein